MINKADIFYVHLLNDYSGSPRVLRDLIEKTHYEYSNAFVLTSQHNGFLNFSNIKKVTIPYIIVSNKLFQLLFLLLNQTLLVFSLSFYLLRSKLKKRKTIVVVNTMLPFGGIVSAGIFSDKLISYIHESYLKPPVFKRFLRFFIDKYSSDVIFVSNYLREAETFTNPTQTVIYNGLRQDFFPRCNLDFEFKFSNKMLFFAGSLKPYKGLDKFLELAKILPDFKFCAAINCDFNELKDFVDSNDPPSNVSLFSRPSNIVDYYRDSFAVLNLTDVDSVIETFGLSLVEGMWFGSPVIGPPKGGPTEFIDETNGLMIDSKEVEKIAKFLYYLSTSKDVWFKYAKSAINSSSQFSPDKYGSEITSFFEKLKFE